MAPEVLSGETFTFTSDIYSLSAVLWEAVTGRLIVDFLLQVNNVNSSCKLGVITPTVNFWFDTGIRTTDWQIQTVGMLIFS